MCKIWKNFEPDTSRQELIKSILVVLDLGHIESDSSKMLPICTNLKLQVLQRRSYAYFEVHLGNVVKKQYLLYFLESTFRKQENTKGDFFQKV